MRDMNVYWKLYRWWERQAWVYTTCFPESWTDGEKELADIMFDRHELKEEMDNVRL